MHRATRVMAAAGALTWLATGARGAIVQPDLLEVTFSKVSRWNADTPGTRYNRETGTIGFGDLTRTNDGRFVAYRGNFTGQTPALYQIDPVTGNSTLLVQSASAAGQVVAMVPMPNGHLFAFDNSL